MRRLSFALIETLVAIVIVGGSLALFLPTMRGVFYKYTQLKKEITSQYLVDEYFSNILLKCVSEGLPEGCFDNEVFQEEDVTYFHDTYTVTVSLYPDATDEGKEKPEKRFIAFEVVVTPSDDSIQSATRRCVLPCTEKK